MTVKAHATTNARVWAALCTCAARPRIGGEVSRSAVTREELLDPITVPSCFPPRIIIVSARTAADAYHDKALQWQFVGQFPARLARWKKAAYLQSSSVWLEQLAACSQLRKC